MPGLTPGDSNAPDPVEGIGDLAVPLTAPIFGSLLAFRSLEALSITIDDNPKQVGAQVTHKEPTGFHLILNTMDAGLSVGGHTLARSSRCGHNIDSNLLF